MSKNSIPSSFKQWITTYSHIDSPMGDFARDVNSSNDYPAVETHEKLQEYFSFQARRYNNPIVLELFNAAWNFYDNLRP